MRQHKTGKYTCGKSRKGLLGFKTIITPSKKAQKQHYKRLAEVINKLKGQSQIVLIDKLNPIIRGWCNYYATVVSQKVFERIVHLVNWKLLKWGIKRHRNKGIKWIKTKYFITESRYCKKEQRYTNRNWVFATKDKNPKKLVQHSDTEITRYVKVKGEVTPYDGRLVYWSSRKGEHPQMPKRTASLLKKQRGKCNWCELYFKDEDVIELDHITPTSKGGEDINNNWQLLHRHCHDKKTGIDGSLDKRFKHIKLPSTWRWENDMLLAY